MTLKLAKFFYFDKKKQKLAIIYILNEYAKAKYYIRDTL